MSESKLAVYSAIAANGAVIAITKFAAAGDHRQLCDAVRRNPFNRGLRETACFLLVGMKLSQRKATSEHPFGHGKELYFWSLMVAVLIFGLGGGISAYEGVLHMLHPAPLRDPTWNYVVLGAAALFESGSFVVCTAPVSHDPP